MEKLLLGIWLKENQFTKSMHSGIKLRRFALNKIYDFSLLLEIIMKLSFMITKFLFKIFLIKPSQILKRFSLLQNPWIQFLLIMIVIDLLLEEKIYKFGTLKSHWLYHKLNGAVILYKKLDLIKQKKI